MRVPIAVGGNAVSYFLLATLVGVRFAAFVFRVPTLASSALGIGENGGVVFASFDRRAGIIDGLNAGSCGTRLIGTLGVARLGHVRLLIPGLNA